MPKLLFAVQRRRVIEQIRDVLSAAISQSPFGTK
jgi:hypothetical protein